ncbi:uncharacterized protein LOC116397989 [Anarrhichthys ocellatus]|uniref:uncharacterized protein LOC116397989 n=1 Tax=Anarrhichthys ocellatus TaxID=433405 RepID=UPI0012EE8965|nr:uncharacterized protein LOC116397989 [Anarrhichthys ocellatus]
MQVAINAPSLLHTCAAGMACGVHLGILLVCLVQAELVRSLWAAQDQRQTGDTHVGFSQQGRFGGSYPQNQLRQASGSPQTANGGYASVMLAQSSSESKPNRPTTTLNQENVQNTPKKQIFGLSVASGSSLGRYDQTPISKKRTRPAQQGIPSTSNYQSSSSGSLQSPRGGYSFKPASHQSAAQRASAVSETPGKGYPKSSSDGAAGPRRIPARTKTSASGRAVRVSPHRGSVAPKPSYFSSLQNERTRNNPSQAGSPYPNKLVPVNVPVNVPDSGTSSSGTSGQKFAPTRTHNIPQAFGGYAIRRLKEPTDQKEVSVGRPQQAYVAPQRPPAQKQAYMAPQRPSPSYKPQAQSVHPEAKWMRIKSRQRPEQMDAAGVLG